MGPLERLCFAFAFVPITIGAALVIGSLDALSLIVWSTLEGPAALTSAVRFLGAAFLALGVILLVAVRDPVRYAAVIGIAGGGLVLGVLARIASLWVDGNPGAVTLALSGGELAAGLAYIALALRSRGVDTLSTLRGPLLPR